MPVHDKDEWQEDEEPYESDPEGLVHPLPKRELEKPVDSTDKLDKPHPFRRVASVLSDTTGSDDGSSDSNVEREPIQPKHSYAEEVVRFHARRVDLAMPPRTDPMSPPPAPIALEKGDIGIEASLEAQKRVAAYRRRLARKEEEQKNQSARDAQNAKHVRTMFKDFNRTLGVADIPPHARYKSAVRAKRTEKHNKEQAAAAESSGRWYRKITRPTRSEYNAADVCAKILEDARLEHHAKLRQKELHRQAINKKLAQLSLAAASIIAESVGAYEPGSFLLKVSPQKTPKPKRTPRSLDSSDNTQAVERKRVR